MSEAFMLRCQSCGSGIPIVRKSDWPTSVTCQSCGLSYQKSGGNPGSNPGSHSPDVGWFVAGAVVGFVLGGVVFTRLGRELAITAVARGAARAEREIREWARLGEK